MAHVIHPRCPSCGRAMYKSMEPKAVKASDPWAYCRNKACAVGGVDQSKTVVLTALGDKTSKVIAGIKAAQPSPKQIKAAKKSIAAAADIPRHSKKQQPTPEAKPSKQEPIEVQRARERIRTALAINGDHSKAAIGLTLTIVAQEMGSHEVANKLIDEFNLSNQFGIEKRRA